MQTTKSSSSSPAAEERLIQVPLDQLHAHPANANVMTPGRREKLARNIARQGRYPPLVVRPHPHIDGGYELLDGHQRLEALRELGYEEATCFLWPCDDATALVLLATLNRLEGEDVPALRAELLAELTALMPADELVKLLPEDAGALEETLALIDLDTDRLLAELTEAAERAAASGPRVVTFALDPEGERIVEAAVTRAGEGLGGRNRRGRALARICGTYLEAHDA